MINIYEIKYQELFSKFKRIRNIIMEVIPDLKFEGNWDIYGFDNKIIKTDEKILGQFIPIDNKIIIYKQCFDTYNNGNKKELISTIIHELIHANGENNEENTLKLEKEYYKMFHKEIEEKLEQLE